MNLSPTWQEDPFLEKLFRLFQSEGFQLYFVGGWVRDQLLGRTAADIDLATDATPTEMISIFQREDIVYKTVGIEFGSLIIWPNISITTFREDVKPYGRKVEVAFTRDLEKDALRRDFTINAIYSDFEGKIHDPMGGIKDLKSKKVKFIGNPNHRIREDYLRILRFFRFSSIYGDDTQGCDPEGMAAIKNLRGDVLDFLSGFRIKTEIFKMFSTRPIYWCLREWEETNTWNWLFSKGTAQNHKELEILEKQYQIDPNPITSLVILGTSKIRNRMELTRFDLARLETISDLAHGYGQSIEAMAYRHGRETTKAILLTRAVLGNESMPSDFEKRIDQAMKRTFPIRAGDLMPIYQGRELGEALRKLEKDWIASGFSLSKVELLELL